MGALCEDIEQRLGVNQTGNVALRCMLTPDNANGLQEVIWNVVRSCGEAVFVLRLKRAGAASTEGVEGGDRPHHGPTDLDQKMHSTMSGLWSPADPLPVRTSALEWPLVDQSLYRTCLEGRRGRGHGRALRRY